jgi:hypothetical protein
MSHLTDKPKPDSVEKNTLIAENRVGVFRVRTDVLRTLPDDLFAAHLFPFPDHPRRGALL